MKPETDFRTKRRRNRPEGTFAHARKQTEEARRREDPGGTHFAYYESGAMSYDQTFFQLLARENIQSVSKLAAERIKQGKPAVALDVMATTSFLNDAQPTAGLAVNLTDDRPVERQQAEASNGIDLIAGDILDAKTWQAMQAWVRTHSPDQAFNFIFSRAVAGLESIPEDNRVFRILFGRLYQLLSEDGGIMFLQTPLASIEYLTEAVPQLNKLPGLKTSYHLPDPLIEKYPNAFGALHKYPIIRLTRQSGSPKELPLV